METKINIRVYQRNELGTIFIWNTDPLSDELRKQPNFEVQGDNSPWIQPKIQMPDVQRMGRVIDTVTDTIMVMNSAVLTEKSRFMFRLSFGSQHEFPTVLEVRPRNEYQGHPKVMRVVKPGGRAVYAASAYVVGLDDDTRKAIKDIVKEAIAEK